jgi:hypothetical protein
MRPTLIYTIPLNGNPAYLDNAARFVDSYHRCDPGVDHDTVIVVNGGKADSFIKTLFSPLKNVDYMEHDNSGWDIGAFQAASRNLSGRLPIFMGSSAFCTRPGWMQRVTQSVQSYGLALFGTMGNQGDGRVNVSAHVRTTGFWIPADLFNRYPIRVTAPQQRYEFEHGISCLSNWIKQNGLHRLVVTWTGEWELEHCDSIPNGFHRGDQSALLIRDRLTERPFYG